jgi:hypothetical protein
VENVSGPGRHPSNHGTPRLPQRLAHRATLCYWRTPDHRADIDVVGVVKNPRYFTLNERPLMEAYFPSTQDPGFLSNFVVRYAPGAGRQKMIAPVRRALAL